MKKLDYVKVYLKEGDEKVIEKIKDETFNSLSGIFRQALYYYYEQKFKQSKGNKK